MIGADYSHIRWRDIRLALGLSQTQMADEMCLTARWLREMEHGRHGPGHRTVLFLRAMLGDPVYAGRLRAARVPNPFD